jgi:hypothetical protein
MREGRHVQLASTHQTKDQNSKELKHHEETSRGLELPGTWFRKMPTWSELNRNLLHLVQRTLILPAVIELGRPNCRSWSTPGKALVGSWKIANHLEQSYRTTLRFLADRLGGI